jgi:hypothetical protein
MLINFFTIGFRAKQEAHEVLQTDRRMHQRSKVTTFLDFLGMT